VYYNKEKKALSKTLSMDSGDPIISVVSSTSIDPISEALDAYYLANFCKV
jgi:hypothetical protein